MGKSNTKQAKTRVLMVLGNTGSGKDTIFHHIKTAILKHKKVHFPTKMTTREMRKSEKQGVEYNFVSKEEYLLMSANDEVTIASEYSIYNKQGQKDIAYYGFYDTDLKEDKLNIIIGDEKMLKEAREQFEDVQTILVNASIRTRVKRAFDREENNQDIQDMEILRRIIADYVELQEGLKDFYHDYEIENNWGTSREQLLKKADIIIEFIKSDLNEM